MLYYLDAIIPLLGGLILLTGGDWLVNETDIRYAKRKKWLRITSWTLVGLSLVYLIIKLSLHASPGS